MFSLTPEITLEIYRMGCFPMANSVNSDEVLIIEPKERAILPIDRLHVPARLAKTIRQRKFEIKIDTAFTEVIGACAEPHLSRPDSWINADIKNVFIELHHQGHAHSVEAWQDNRLVGGLYGLKMGSVFCGESMFSRVTDASKVALVHLCARLWHGGFTLLDAQFSNPHLEQFGQIEIPQEKYLKNLQTGLNAACSFASPEPETALLTRYLDHLQSL